MRPEVSRAQGPDALPRRVWAGGRAWAARRAWRRPRRTRAGRLGWAPVAWAWAMYALLVPAATLGATPAVGSAAEAAAVVEAVRARVEQLRAGHEVRALGVTVAARALVAQVYERRGFRAAWNDPTRGQALLGLVEGSSDHGLDPADYHLESLRAMVAALPAERSADPGQRADREIVFSDALIRLAYHLHFGKVDPRELFPSWNLSRSLGAIDPSAAVEAILVAPDLRAAVERYAPHLAIYIHLQQGLARHRAIAARGGWGSIPSGPALKPGTRDRRVAALRRRLHAAGDLPARTSQAPEHFDAALVAAVERFQRRHGLAVDGIAGRSTIDALNVPVGRRIDQIRVNLERLRWVAQEIGGDFLLVDIAGFEAHLVIDRRRAWWSRVVVGRPYRGTPTFRATLRYLVLNPTWTVPPTMLREDVLPEVAKDPRWLTRNRMSVIDRGGRRVDPAGIDWRRYPAEPFPYQIVQAPGATNPLGEIKLMLPNPHAIYLHDTPTKALFEKTERAFSSGCIRVEKPLELAALLLDDPERWSVDALRAAIALGETRTVTVSRQVPVLLLYFTATADEEGTVFFRPDLYERDPQVLAALARPFRLSPATLKRN